MNSIVLNLWLRSVYTIGLVCRLSRQAWSLSSLNIPATTISDMIALWPSFLHPLYEEVTGMSSHNKITKSITNLAAADRWTGKAWKSNCWIDTNIYQEGKLSEQTFSDICGDIHWALSSFDSLSISINTTENWLDETFLSRIWLWLTTQWPYNDKSGRMLRLTACYSTKSITFLIEIKFCW